MSHTESVGVMVLTSGLLALQVIKTNHCWVTAPRQHANHVIPCGAMHGHGSCDCPHPLSGVNDFKERRRGVSRCEIEVLMRRLQLALDVALK